MESKNAFEEAFGDNLNFVKDGKITSVSKKEALAELMKIDFIVFFFGANFSPPSRLLSKNLMY